MSIADHVVPYLEALPTVAGRRALVTGANSGLGKETARFLASRGAEVVMTARDLDKGARARDEVLADTPGAVVTLAELDLASLDSVARFAAGEAARDVDVLVCNAGIMALERSLTEDGFESQLGINHLGHFALVGRLWERLSVRPGARVVVVSSGAAYMGSIAFDDLMGQRSYDRWRAYNQSKLANVVFSLGLARRLAAAGGHASAHAAHPGLVFTQLQRRVLETSPDLSLPYRLFLSRITPALGQDPQMGALPQVYAALSQEATSGDFWGPRWTARGRPVKVRLPRAATDVGLQDRLWRESERLTGVSFGG